MEKTLLLKRNPDPSLTKRFDFWVCMYDYGTMSEKKKYLGFINDIVLNPISSPSQIQTFLTVLSKLLGDEGSALTSEAFDTLCCDVLKSSKNRKVYPQTETDDDEYYRMLACISQLTGENMRSHELAEFQLSDVPNACYYKSEAMTNNLKFQTQKLKKFEIH